VTDMFGRSAACVSSVVSLASRPRREAVIHERAIVAMSQAPRGGWLKGVSQQGRKSICVGWLNGGEAELHLHARQNTTNQRVILNMDVETMVTWSKVKKPLRFVRPIIWKQRNMKFKVVDVSVVQRP
jgi:hypothetical protein